MQLLLEALEQGGALGAPLGEGMAAATTTPASVACTPDFKTHSQIDRPISK
jgi:hypothetical protein